MHQRVLTVFSRMHLIAGAVSIMVGVSAMDAAAQKASPLENYRWQKRVLLVFAADAGDSALLEQRRIVAQASADAADRDLVVIEVTGANPTRDAALRRHFGVADGFRTVLVGKDGGAKLSVGEPLTAERWIETIDAMPMRRQEQKGRSGS